MSSEENNNADKEHYLLGAFLYEYEIWAINYLDDRQFLFLKNDKELIQTFKDDTEAKEFAASNGITLAPGMDLLDLDSIIEWIRYEGSEVDCKAFINAYNCTESYALAAEKPLPHPDDYALTVLQKLYKGSNDPHHTEPGEEFEATWCEFEILVIKRLMTDVILFWMNQLEKEVVPDYYWED